MNISYIILLKTRLFKIPIILLMLFAANVSYSQISDTGKIILKLSNLHPAKDSLSNPTELKLNSGSQLPKREYKVNYIKLGAITGITAGAFLWLHNYQRNSWWAGQRGHFHFQNDWEYAKSADKFGHFFDGLLIQSIYRGALEWSGFSPTASVWLGAAFSLAYMTDVEIEDGFATDWGFSLGDETANLTGALYPVAQYYWKPLRSFNIKWSYYPSEELTGGQKNGAFLDDYDGQTMWLSVNVHDFLGKKAQKFWPDYLNIATGYGVTNYKDLENRYTDIYFGLDLNWERIIPGKSNFMMWFKNVINHFRFLPVPAIRINKNGITYIVHW
ncbi:MAG: DUF2279 domain-containing protein [Ignavibacteria bacterium]